MRVAQASAPMQTLLTTGPTTVAAHRHRRVSSFVGRTPPPRLLVDPHSPWRTDPVRPPDDNNSPNEASPRGLRLPQPQPQPQPQQHTPSASGIGTPCSLQSSSFVTISMGGASPPLSPLVPRMSCPDVEEDGGVPFCTMVLVLPLTSAMWSVCGRLPSVSAFVPRCLLFPLTFSIDMLRGSLGQCCGGCMPRRVPPPKQRTPRSPSLGSRGSSSGSWRVPPPKQHTLRPPSLGPRSSSCGSSWRVPPPKQHTLRSPSLGPRSSSSPRRVLRDVPATWPH